MSTGESDEDTVSDSAPSQPSLHQLNMGVATGQAGGVAVLTVRGRAQLVVIVDEQLRPAVRAIACSLESDPQ